ncbi:hypothetical protein KGA66_06015 [Actinocrinis puniceicyclus]|uniref:Phage tail protein n=1 Tax=Actinocrinis puniceicyclus TaxID=977794 RepID=A0A8J7WMK7_9ACTN|nr:hypothetical protein [Actinocrinis puniceicyclus]MBS2962594.1 hypothetical protein [Actinocrinis puniceicyclus]
MPTALDGDPTWLGDLPLNVIDDNGVAWIVTSTGGWSGGAATTQQVVQRQSDHGGYASGSWLTPKPLTPAVTIQAPTAALRDTAVEALKAAASLTATTMRVQEAGYDRTRTVQRQGEPLVTKYGTSAEVSLSLVAADPRLYSATGYTGSCGLPSVIGGLTFPAAFPLVFDATVSSGQIPVANIGTVGSRPMLRITGPCVTPVVTLQDPDGSVQQLIYNGTLQALDYLDLDCDRHTAIINGTASRRGLLTVAGGWPQIPPRADVTTAALYFNANSTTGAPILTASWYDAWE